MPPSRPAQNWAETQWAALMSPDQAAPSRRPGFAPRPAGPPSKAEATTSEARRLTEAATETRNANVARLREARMAREAQERAEAAVVASPAPTKRSRTARART